jgi:hypothetical protein
METLSTGRPRLRLRTVSTAKQRSTNARVPRQDHVDLQSKHFPDKYLVLRYQCYAVIVMGSSKRDMHSNYQGQDIEYRTVDDGSATPGESLVSKVASKSTVNQRVNHNIEKFINRENDLLR